MKFKNQNKDDKSYLTCSGRVRSGTQPKGWRQATSGSGDTVLSAVMEFVVFFFFGRKNSWFGIDRMVMVVILF